MLQFTNPFSQGLERRKVQSQDSQTAANDPGARHTFHFICPYGSSQWHYVERALLKSFFGFRELQWSGLAQSRATYISGTTARWF